MLNVKNINQYYGGSHILRDVSLQAHQGKVTVLLAATAWARPRF
jgi:urea transport system ATP-binding protein